MVDAKSCATEPKRSEGKGNGEDRALISSQVRKITLIQLQDLSQKPNESFRNTCGNSLVDTERHGHALQILIGELDIIYHQLIPYLQKWAQSTLRLLDYDAGGRRYLCRRDFWGAFLRKLYVVFAETSKVEMEDIEMAAEKGNISKGREEVRGICESIVTNKHYLENGQMPLEIELGGIELIYYLRRQ